MENETASAEPPVPARLQFHLGLLSVFLPLMWVVVAVGALSGKATPSPEQARWKRYLGALLAADLLVFACYGWILAHPDRTERPPRQPEQPLIGILWGPDPATQPRIEKVLPGLPADRAGFEAGDLIESIDGVPVATRAEATDQIRSAEVGVVRTIRIRRYDVPIDLQVAAELPPRVQRKLFEPQPADKSRDLAGAAIGFLPAIIVVAIAAVVSRFKRRAAVVTWRGFIVALGGSLAAALGTLLLFRALQGGSSRGAMLVMLFAQMAALLGLTRLATVWCGRDVPPPADPVKPLAPARAALLGVYYLVTGVARVSVVTFVADQIFFKGAASGQTSGLESLATSSLGLWGNVLFLFVTVLLGPLAEESLFRGFLVPRLAAMWGTLASMVVSSLIFAIFHPYHPMVLPIVFTYGFVFAWARLRTGGIGVPFLLHLLLNGLVSAVFLMR